MKQETMNILKFTVGEGDFEAIEKAAQSLKENNIVVVQFRCISRETEAQYRKILEDVVVSLEGSTNRISTYIYLFMPNGITAQCFEG